MRATWSSPARTSRPPPRRRARRTAASLRPPASAPRRAWVAAAEVGKREGVSEVMQTAFEVGTFDDGAHRVVLTPRAEAPEVISLEGIHKTYSMGDVEVHALRGVTLSIREGEFV